MKTILILAVLMAGAWLLMSKLRQNAEVKKMQEAPVAYTKALQSGVKKAEAAEDAAAKKIAEMNKTVSDAVKTDQ